MEDKKNTCKPKMDIEALGDYSFELLAEISRFIGELPNSQLISSNKFIDIFNKLKKAQSLGVNVKKYEEEIYEFRSALLSRKIQDKIKELNLLTQTDNKKEITFDITYLEHNFEEFKSDYDSIDEIEQLLKQLKEILVHKKISFMITESHQGGHDSEYDFENIMRELQIAQDQGIDTKELQMQILGE